MEGGSKRPARSWSVYDLAVLGMMVALMEVSKRALDFLPNIELISFLTIVFTLFYGWKTLAAVYAFVAFECFYFGFGTWSIAYLYVWPLLVCLVMATRKIGRRRALFYALLSGAFGLSFGFLCSLYTLVTFGPATQFAWWVSGIPYDIVHCLGNFGICLVLFAPVTRLMDRLTRSLGRGRA